VTLTIGTRGSMLATTQAGHVRDALIAAGYPAELTIISTPGDRSQAPVERIGVGVFTQALREALHDGDCDIAVHSFKDLPTSPDPRFHFVVPPRADAREALIARDNHTLDTLPHGARVGTSAPRRISQLLALRPDLDIQPLRGNIDTRMGRVGQDLDAVILACAGLERVGMLDRATQCFDPHIIMPAPAQGALAVECRSDDARAVAAVDLLADPDTTVRATAERTLLSCLEAGCTAPVAAFADIRAGRLELRAGVFALDGSRQLIHSAMSDVSEAAELGERVARELLAQGASDVMRS
jgi:hydroxymethylbilane synthase